MQNEVLHILYGCSNYVPQIFDLMMLPLDIY